MLTHVWRWRYLQGNRTLQIGVWDEVTCVLIMSWRGDTCKGIELPNRGTGYEVKCSLIQSGGDTDGNRALHK